MSGGSLLNIPRTHFLRSIFLSNFKRLSFPFKCSLAITYRCNMHCKMCNIWRKPERKELDVEEIDRFFKNAPDFSWVGITGGEPFLRDDIVDIIEAIVRRSRRLCTVHIATNGFLADRIRSTIGKVRKRHKDLELVFTVSIDGPPDIHDFIRGVNGVWQRAMDTFFYLKQTPGCKVQFGFTMSRRNAGRFKEAFYAIKHVYPALRFDDVNVNIFQKSDFSYDNQDVEAPDRDRLLEEIKEILSMDKDRFSINNFLRRTYLRLYPLCCRLKKTPVKCQAFSSSLFIDPYGNMFPCVVYNKKIINIKEMSGDFALFWNSGPAKELSRECSQNICPVCWSPCDAFSSISGSLWEALTKHA
ncbi:MAG: radical SAM protein [Candidatus Omnitrophota bacterium]